MSFFDNLQSAISKNKSLLCVGLDPDITKIPTRFKRHTKSLFSFSKHVVESTKDIACTYKINSAFYEATGKINELRDTVEYIKKHAAEIPVILDAKRGDIGNTATQYAKYCYDYLQVDATTLNPYMGYDSLEPFIGYKDKGSFILCLTSNAGSKDFQQQKIGSHALYEIIAKKVAKWNIKSNNLGIVVGATKPFKLLSLRKSHPSLPFLVPGIGTQAGDLEKSVRYGTKNNSLCIFNVSRKILYPLKGETIRKTALAIRSEINKYLT